MLSYKKIEYIFFFIIFLLCINSMFFRYLWNVYSILIIIGGCLCPLFTILLYKNKLNLSDFPSIFIFILITLYISISGNLNGFINNICLCLVVSSFILIPIENKTRFFNFFTSYFTYLVLISLIGYILFMFGIHMSPLRLIFGENVYDFDDYIIFLIIHNPYTIEIFPRFQGLFLEPGHLGTIIPFILFGYGFNLKRNKKLIILLIALILTFSLASYVLALIGYLLINIKSKKIFIFIPILLFLLFLSVNSDNLINELILSRIDFESGSIDNNRTTVIFDNKFTEFINDRNNLLLGIGVEEYSKLLWIKGAAGYKVFIYKFGLIGLILLSSFYLTITKNSSKKYFHYYLLAIYVISFYQRDYALWLIQIIIFISIISYLKKHE